MSGLLVNIDELLGDGERNEHVEGLLALMALGNRLSTLVVLLHDLHTLTEQDVDQSHETARRGHECALLTLIASTIHEFHSIIERSSSIREAIGRANPTLLNEIDDSEELKRIGRIRNKIGSHFDGGQLRNEAKKVSHYLGRSPEDRWVQVIHVPRREPREIRYQFVDNLFFSMFRKQHCIDFNEIGEAFVGFINEVFRLANLLLEAIFTVVKSWIDSLPSGIVLEQDNQGLAGE